MMRLQRMYKGPRTRMGRRIDSGPNGVLLMARAESRGAWEVEGECKSLSR